MGKIAIRFALMALLAPVIAACSSATGVTGVTGSIPAETFATYRMQPIPASYEPVHTLPVSQVQAATPPGYVSFCIRFADQCATDPGSDKSVALNDAVWTELSRVNVTVNDEIVPEDDQEHYGRAEYWTIPTDGRGDCEDYALTKRRDLIQAGLSPAALRIAVVMTWREERHAVLTVTTDKGDFVLDNLQNRIVAWDDAGYTWVERQDPALGWATVGPANRMMAANTAVPTSASGGY